jgi:hypothetical protein
LTYFSNIFRARLTCLVSSFAVVCEETEISSIQRLCKTPQNIVQFRCHVEPKIIEIFNHASATCRQCPSMMMASSASPQ